ncbi:MAG: hypothetical protein U0228_23655 [Myxococcaceae bacterium]
MTALALLVALAATPAVEFTVTADLEKSVLQIELDLRDWKGECLCLDKDVADALSGLGPHPKREDCFLAPEKRPVKYQVSLSKLRRRYDDPDFAAHLGPAWMFHDATFLLRPDEFEGDYRVRFVLPSGATVATPWPQEKDGTFVVSEDQFDVGSYVALGKLRTLGVLELEGFSARVTLVDEPRAATDAQLLAWVKGALTAHGKFYRGSPTHGARPIHVVLAGVKSSDAGVFGSVLRRGEPSVMLLFGNEATSGFESDWVAFHELFHLGNPPTRGRFPWITEGLTTYYTELLRARAGVLPPEQVWGTLADSFRDYCSPNGTSLADHSRELSRTWQYQRVYWGGACLWFQVDVEVRKKSKGARSLDDVVRELREGDALDEDGLVAALDKAAGSPIATVALKREKKFDVEPLLKSLGVGVVKNDRAALDDSAPLAALRKAMTAPEAK